MKYKLNNNVKYKTFYVKLNLESINSNTPSMFTWFILKYFMVLCGIIYILLLCRLKTSNQ